jgi:hypothetical protein
MHILNNTSLKILKGDMFVTSEIEACTKFVPYTCIYVVGKYSNRTIILSHLIFKDKNRMHKRLMCAPGHDRTHK